MAPSADALRCGEEVKSQKAEAEALRTELLAGIAALAEELAAFQTEHAKAGAQLAALGAQPAAVVKGQARLPPLSEAGETLTLCEREREASSAERSLAGLEAQLKGLEASCLAAEAGLAGGAGGEMPLLPPAPVASQLVVQTETSAQFASELVALLRGLSGLEVLSAAPEMLRLRLGGGHSLSLQLVPGAPPRVRAAALEGPHAQPMGGLLHQCEGRMEAVVREAVAMVAEAERAALMA